MFDSSTLVQNGVTNLIDVDGMLYAPVSDLWAFFQRYAFDRVVPVLACVLMYVVAGFLVFRVLPRPNKEKSQ